MAKKIYLQVYIPWWFRLYAQSVHTFAYLAGLEVDADKLAAQAQRSIRYREIEPPDEAKL
ncbi:hypothetical protein SAMN05216178_3988 [Pseudomonas saponiphila]|uniref:Uncharacterized protein n=1 Tax=Pseudomonas saponiphila TaxID=556534 RepID=A0A1H4R0N8_9PSED|nr:hypothetical protein [Pseudomonas saponiphila]SEC25327.1 hypothetical protein SAMN05216178_3988 [Pseudomonas saponiphila]